MYLLIQKCPRPEFNRVYPIEFFASLRLACLRAAQMNKEYEGTSKFEVWEVEVKGNAQETVSNK